MNSGRGPLLETFMCKCCECLFAFCLLLFSNLFHGLLLSETPPLSQTVEAPVRGKGFGSSRGGRRSWVLRSVERERNTHWAGWRQSGLAGWQASGRAANLVDERRAGLVDPAAFDLVYES